MLGPLVRGAQMYFTRSETGKTRASVLLAASEPDLRCARGTRECMLGHAACIRATCQPLQRSAQIASSCETA